MSTVCKAPFFVGCFGHCDVLDTSLNALQNGDHLIKFNKKGQNLSVALPLSIGNDVIIPNGLFTEDGRTFFMIQNPDESWLSVEYEGQIYNKFYIDISIFAESCDESSEGTPCDATLSLQDYVFCEPTGCEIFTKTLGDYFDVTVPISEHKITAPYMAVLYKESGEEVSVLVERLGTSIRIESNVNLLNHLLIIK
jgi:hypothetical protein